MFGILLIAILDMHQIIIDIIYCFHCVSWFWVGNWINLMYGISTIKLYKTIYLLFSILL